MKILVVVIAVALILIYFITLEIRTYLSAFSKILFGRGTLLSAVEAAKELEADTPASVSAMTSVYLPRILKDFPELNYEEMKNKSETMLTAFFKSIDRESIDKDKITNGNLQDIIKHRIESNKSGDKKEAFREIIVHRTEIKDYISKGSFCRITLQSAVEYMYSENVNTTPVNKCQTKWNQEWLYIQNPDKLPESIKNYDGVGLVCPNCGGPIKSLGARNCEYCGSAVVPINMRVWELHEIKKA